MFNKPSFAMAVLLAASCSAQAVSDNDLAAIRSQIDEMKKTYEQRIASLEKKLADAEVKSKAAPVPPVADARPVCTKHGEQFQSRGIPDPARAIQGYEEC
jgi:hypothetical protein